MADRIATQPYMGRVLMHDSSLDKVHTWTDLLNARKTE